LVARAALAAVLGLGFLHVAGAHVRYSAWSDTQTSNPTPYPQARRSLLAIFERLCCLVASGNAVAPITPHHEVLLR